MKLIIEDDEGRKTVVPFVREEITIGRQDGNTIKLTERNVSRRHARLVKADGTLLIEDLGSYNGVRVNGDRINGPTKVKEGDLIEIGDYDLGIQGKPDSIEKAPPPPAPKPSQRTLPPTGQAKPPGAPAQPQTQAAPHPQQPATEPPAAPSAPATTPASSAAPAAGATAIIRVSDIMKSAGTGEVRDLEKSEMPRLVCLAGQYRGKEFYLMRSEVKIGRTEENDIGIDHASISRQHCRLVLEDGAWKVYDNKSANGVHINGEPYAIAAVKPGDTIELGHVKFRFCAPGERFVLPPEKKEGAAGESGAPRPTTAELIAGAQGRAAPAPAAKKSNLPLFAGIGVAAVLLLGAAAFFALRKGSGGDDDEAAAEQRMSPKAAAKAGDNALKAHRYTEAVGLYAQAGDKANPASRKKAEAEAKGEEIYDGLDAAIAKGNFDVARAQLEKCAGESGFYCSKANDKADAVKAGYAKIHLAKATTAKAAGKTDVCSSETALVLAFDPANADATALSGTCNPAEKPVAGAPKDSGPNQGQRDAAATRKVAEGNGKVQSRDFQGAIASFNDAINQKPSKPILGQAYRGLGIAYIYAGDAKKGVQYFKLYLPLCPPGERTQLEQTIARYGG